jgi:hypothetical protein
MLPITEVLLCVFRDWKKDFLSKQKYTIIKYCYEVRKMTVLSGEKCAPNFDSVFWQMNFPPNSILVLPGFLKTVKNQGLRSAKIVIRFA